MATGTASHKATGDVEPFQVVIAGSVDHGKSTLLGRILLDCKQIPNDIIQNVRQLCTKQNLPIQPSFFLDAFKEEQEQNITIDTTCVCFKYAEKRFVFIDVPGHLDFLKNMTTGASKAELGLLLIDVNEGFRTQTLRHIKMLALLGLHEIIVAINKLDTVNYRKRDFIHLAEQVKMIIHKEGLRCDAIIPIVALTGENVFNVSSYMSWFHGKALIPTLATTAAKRARTCTNLPANFRMILQDIYFFDNIRRFAGRVISGRVKNGDRILFSPSGKMAKILKIERWTKKNAGIAQAGDSVAFQLEEQIFVERGEIVSAPDESPTTETILGAKIAWFGNAPFQAQTTYILKIGTAEVHCHIELLKADTQKLTNGSFANILIHCARPIAFDVAPDASSINRLVICSTHETVAAGVTSPYITRRKTTKKFLTSDYNIKQESGYITRSEHEKIHRGAVIWLTGLSGAGKSSLARALERSFHNQGRKVIALDADNLRADLCADLRFSPQDRAENVRRIAHVAKLFLNTGFIVIVACISPYSADRETARTIIGANDYFEIFVYCPLETCRQRDPKKLYARAAAGQIRDISGISAPYQIPRNPALRLDTSTQTISEEVERINRLIRLHTKNHELKLSRK